MDSPSLTFPDLAAFCVAISGAGIGAVVVRRIHEIRPRTLAGHAVEVGEQRWTELAAYQGGTLYTARLMGADPNAIEADLLGRGFQVRSVRGNIG